MGKSASSPAPYRGNNAYFQQEYPQQGNGPGPFTSGPFKNVGRGGTIGPDYFGAAEQQNQSSQNAIGQQTGANRPNQQTDFASSQWTQDPKTGAWTQKESLAGPLSQTASDLEQQAQRANASPLDFSGLPQIGNGADARKAAEDAIYSREASRLDPQWQQRADSERTRLLNEGFNPGSEAFTKEMGDFNRARNDAYATAQRESIMGGGAEQQRQFGMDYTRRQQALAEMLKGRTMPLEQLQGLRGFDQMPGFYQAGAWQPTQYLPAMDSFGNYQLGQASQANQFAGDIVGGAAKIGAGAAAASDERLKTDIRRGPHEAAPGIPAASWRWKGDKSGKRYRGVIAQDAEKVRPDAVHEGDDGIKRVDYGKLSMSY